MFESLDAQVKSFTWEYCCTRQESLAKTAYACSIDDFTWSSDGEVLQVIKQANSDMHDVLAVYLDAHKAWFEFAVQCRQQNKRCPLSGEDYRMMGSLMLERDKASHSCQQMIG